MDPFQANVLKKYVCYAVIFTLFSGEMTMRPWWQQIKDEVGSLVDI